MRSQRDLDSELIVESYIKVSRIDSFDGAILFLTTSPPNLQVCSF